jgi:hypothetical protein
VLHGDPTTLSDSDLMQEMRSFTEWADFLGGQLSLCEIEENWAEQTVKVTEEVTLLRLMPSGEALRKREDSMTRARAEMGQLPEVKQARQELAQAYARRKLILRMWERYDRDAAFLSRELSRRDGGEDAKVRRARGRFGT